MFRVDQLHPLLKGARAIEILSSNDVATIRNISQLILDDKRYTALTETKASYSIKSKNYIEQYEDAKKGTAFTL